MGTYDIQQVCLNGHQITDSYNDFPQHRKNFCDKCGEATIHKCPACSHPIKGFYRVEGVISAHETSVPSHCENCGKPYPWSIPKEPAIVASLPHKDSLHPWPIILAMLQELPSDDVCRIIDSSGIQVNWGLTTRQAATHRTRKREYFPRIQNAYEELSEDNKLSATWLVVEQIRRMDEDLSSELDTRLSSIGWEIGTDGLTTHDVELREMFFPTGRQYDAYVEIRGIIQKAAEAVLIVDPYIDSTVFQLLSSNSSAHLKVRLLSWSLPSDFELEASKFISQHSHFELEIRRTREFHDRFIICDDRHCFHIGASIKDAGKRAFMISKLEDPSNIQALLEQLQDSWGNASVEKAE